LSEWTASAARWAAVAIVAALLLLQVRRGRPYALALPTSPVANTRSLPREFRDLVDFLGGVRRSLPAGARISVLSASVRAPIEDYMNYLVAIGQLPASRVEYPAWRWSPGAPEPLPDFVAAFGDFVPDPRFAVVTRSGLGSLWRRRR
jgi:hypothetical protein